MDRLVAFGVAASLLGLLPAVATGWIFDRIVPGAARSQLLLVVLGLTASTLSVALFQLSRTIAVLRLQTRMESDLQAGIWDRLLDLPVPFFRRFTAGDLADRSLGVTRIRDHLTGMALSAVFTLVFSLLSFAVLFYYDARLALVACAVFAVVIAVTGPAAQVQRRYQNQLSEVRGEIAGFVLQLITGLARIRVAGAEVQALALWCAALQRAAPADVSRAVRRKQSRHLQLGHPARFSPGRVRRGLALRRSDLSLGAFLAFSAAFAQMLAATLNVSSLVGCAAAVMSLHERAARFWRQLPNRTPRYLTSVS